MRIVPDTESVAPKKKCSSLPLEVDLTAYAEYLSMVKRISWRFRSFGEQLAPVREMVSCEKCKADAPPECSE